MRNFDHPFDPSNDLVVVDPGTLNASLEYFTITPASIAPFEEALMSWKVVHFGPTSQEVRINNLPVPSEGTAILRPSSSLSNVLSVKHQGSFVKLGTANLNVNTTTCMEGGIAEAVGILGGSFQESFKRDPDIELVNEVVNGQPTGEKIKPTVVIDELGISLEFTIKPEVPKLPNPRVKGHFHFRWGVIDGVIQPVFTKNDVNSKFPFYTYGIPGFLIAAPLIESQIRDKVRDSIRNGLINFAALFLRAPLGYDVLNVRTSSAGRGSIITKVCPSVSTATIVQATQPSIFKGVGKGVLPNGNRNPIPSSK